MSKNLLCLLLLLLPSIALAQNRSVYTNMAPAGCRTKEVDKGMPGNYSGKCPGVGGYELEVYSDDERNSVGIVLPSKEVIGLDLWNYFAHFSALGEKAEWRMRGKTPIALITRLNVSDRGEGKPTSYLIVSKLSKTGACVTDVVKPGTNQNRQAQRLADIAVAKSCKKPL
jgi:hypothetical protein